MKIHGGIAQSVEHTAHIRDVYGSIPYSAKARASRVFFFASIFIQINANKTHRNAALGTNCFARLTNSSACDSVYGGIFSASGERQLSF